MAESLRGRGFPTVACGLGWRAPEILQLMTERDPLERAEAVAFTFERIFAGAMARAMWHDLSALATAWRPDLILREVTEFGSPLLAQSLDVPLATVVFGSVSSDLRVIDRVATAIGDRSVEIGLDPNGVLVRCRRATRIAMVPDAYDPDEPADMTILRHRPVEVDDLAGEGCPPGAERLFSSPTVYATLGTVYHHVPGLLDEILRAFDGAEWNLILSTGEAKHLRRLGELPPNVFAAAYIPNSTVMSRCAGVVCHGGYSTTIGALLHGRPSVLLPRGADHFLHSRCVVRLGAATALEVPEQNASKIREAVSHMMQDTAMHAAARSLQRELAALPDVTTVVEHLERILRADPGNRETGRLDGGAV